MAADYLTGKTGLDQLGHPANMVDMGMGEDEAINIAGSNRKHFQRGTVIIPLGGAAVDQESAATMPQPLRLHQVARAGDLAGSAEEFDPHARLPLDRSRRRRA